MSSQFAIELDNDLDWREKELASLKKNTLICPDKSVSSRAMLRAMWTLLYAHYEGFCKFVWDAFLEHIEKEKIHCSLLNKNLKILAFDGFEIIKSLKSNTSTENVLDFFSNFSKDYSSLVKFNKKLGTGSNLYPNILEDNVNILSIPLELLDEHRMHLKALVTRRNKIAHGEKMIIKNIQEYTIYEKAVYLIMHDLAINAIDVIEHKRYLEAR